ncbi:hypothetical protein BaRGS_00011156 [Batillaria attramentaria]|uniref:Uncharacterized protein n=1 Tax=Batillaria attramentaria TaxID=370345 RepID=A0ABD0LDG1_9CAEN
MLQHCGGPKQTTVKEAMVKIAMFTLISNNRRAHGLCSQSRHRTVLLILNCLTPTPGWLPVGGCLPMVVVSLCYRVAPPRNWHEAFKVSLQFFFRGERNN